MQALDVLPSDLQSIPYASFEPAVGRFGPGSAQTGAHLRPTMWNRFWKSSALQTEQEWLGEATRTPLQEAA